jgi:protein-S-isoprenylcysteine O-methyltransferase Ste14
VSKPENARGRTRLPELGARGRGWVVIQIALFWVLIAAGVRGRGDAEGPVLLVAMVTGCALIAIGAAVLWSGVKKLGPSLSALPRPRDNGQLIEDGVYAYVRHPIYLGIILVAFGWSVATDSVVGIVVSFVSVLFYDLKARREEAWLRDRYPGYGEYARRTKRLVPYVY